MHRIIIEKMPLEKARKKGVESWPIWNKEVSVFNWEYDSDEHCYILEGEVLVETTEGDFRLKAGDYVVFKKGLKCVWNIKKEIKKHFFFPEN